ncbi:LysE family translocator [Breoghania sp.]|uniref:LysE family translocator n=1 Tax=Breoghania sp. TaxID=2065378 RepID=UPI002AA6EC15|nr:LysE family translocator [Breoghania sp.]
MLTELPAHLPSFMPAERYALLSLFILAASGTPGPGNMALAALGGTHGPTRTLPFLAGMLVGFTTTLWLAAAGLLALISSVPVLQGALQLACFAYILYLAWIIAFARPGTVSGSAASRAPGFLRGLWVHPLNPKAYAMQIAALSQFAAPDHYLRDVSIISLTFVVLGGGANFCWAMAGTLMARLAGAPSRLRAINVTLAALMVASTMASLLIA